MSSLSVVPAYGKDFTSQKAIREHFDNNGDFLIQDISSRYDGSYVNREDLINFDAPYKHLKVRYKKLREVFMMPLNLPKKP